ncbi:hypothetical protein [Mesorhizobium sp. IMUNJ 23232]
MPSVAKYTLAVSLTAAVTGATFAAWAAHGPDMFMAMIQSGLSWCF